MKDENAALLERFILDNPDLERLESILDDFNPFVAMRWTRQETRHSSFLRWLLDPNETHGLGSYFLRQFMKYIASRSPQGTSELPSKNQRGRESFLAARSIAIFLSDTSALPTSSIERSPHFYLLP